MNDHHTRKAQKIKPAISTIAKIVLFFLIILGLCLVLFGILFNFLICNKSVVQQIYSPDRNHKVVVSVLNCGATTDFSTEVSVVKSFLPQPFGRSNVLSMEGYPDDSLSDVKWTANNSLLIMYDDDYEIYFQKTRLRDFFTVINIDFEPKVSP